MKRFTILACVCGFAVSMAIIPGNDVSASGAAPAPDPASQQFYTTRVVDILQNNCMDCHDETAKGGLRLDSYAGIKKGGEDGAVIVPGDPDASMLIQAIRRQGDLKMPPKKVLDPAAVTDLVAWVKAGAVGSDPATGAAAQPSASPAPAASTTSTASIQPVSAITVDADFFENKVRPIFANSCYDCHDETAKGGLRLDTKAGFEKGGKNGAEVIAGDPEKSRLIQAVEQTGELKMPKGSGKLKPEDIAALVAWVKAGANWPASASAPLDTTATTGVITESSASSGPSSLSKLLPSLRLMTSATSIGRALQSITSSWPIFIRRASLRRSRPIAAPSFAAPRTISPAFRPPRLTSRHSSTIARATRGKRLSIGCLLLRDTASAGWFAVSARGRAVGDPHGNATRARQAISGYRRYRWGK